MWDRATVAGSALVWLLDLDVGGYVLRVASLECDVPQQDGSTVAYRGGLVVGDWSDGIDLFTASPAARQIPMEVRLDGDVEAWQTLARQGHRLATATATVSVWPEGGTVDDVRVVLRGCVDEPEHGGAEEPVRLSVVEDAVDATGLIPEADARVIDWPSPSDPRPTTWDGCRFSGNPDHVGERYPIVIGRPGRGTAASGDSLDSVQALAVHNDAAATVNYGLLIAGHLVIGTQVTIYDADDDVSEALTVVEMGDDLGRRVAVVSLAAAASLTWDPDHAYWVRWTQSGGLAGHDGSEMTGAGQVLRWMLERSQAQIDRGRLAAAIPILDGYRIDAVVVATPEARIRPLDWVREHLSPILPISMRRGPEGLYPVVWRYDAASTDAVAVLDADAARAVRTSPLSWTSVRDCYAEVEVWHRRDHRTQTYTSRVLLSGDPQARARDDTAVPHALLRASWIDGVRRRLELRSDVVADDATAGRSAAWLAQRYALPTRGVAYTVEWSEVSHVEPGDVVIVRDAEVGISEEVAVVQAVTLAETGATIRVRLLERPGGRRS